jgi:protein-S-isoprenylcysteine O-methyltransferase Ste14
MADGIFLALVAACILAYLSRGAYEILKDKGLLRPNGSTFLVMFANMALLWLSWGFVCGLDPHVVHFHLAIRLVGLSLFGTGIVLFLVGLLTLRTLESYEGDLVTTGIYSKIRHPMYLGFILWLIGLPVFFGGLVSSILSPVFIVNVLWWRWFEEKELESRFPSFKAYRKVTPF